jgi:hypothetical protein
MSVSGGFHIVVAIEIDGLGAVTEVDAEQPSYVIMHVVVVLDLQLFVRVRR